MVVYIRSLKAYYSALGTEFGVEHMSTVTQSCPTLATPWECNPLGSSLHGFFFQARILEQVAISYSRYPLTLGLERASLGSLALPGGFSAISVTWEAC